MNLLQLAAVAGSALALSAGAAYAQYSSTPSASTSGANASSMSAQRSGKVSDADMKRIQACKAMSRDAAMKDTGCVKMMKAHPEMMGGSTSGPAPNP